jgi:nucleotide-binding universal stress UspA family protein
VHVLVGTDGSEFAVSVARRGVALLARPDRVTVLTVITRVPTDLADDWEDSFEWPDEQDVQWQAQIAQADAALGRTAAALPGLRVEERIEGGDVAPTICEVARELGVDAIVVGSHTRGVVGRLVAGSVSEHVVRRAPCPVLVVR